MNKTALPDYIVRMLHDHSFGVLATYGGEYPYTSLISLHVSTDSHTLIFPTLRETRKFANMLHDVRVSVLMDNRSTTPNNTQNLYAITLLGTAKEVDTESRSDLQEQLLDRHPNLLDFLSQSQTAIVQVTLKKIILVEELQKIQEFDL